MLLANTPHLRRAGGIASLLVMVAIAAVTLVPTSDLPGVSFSDKLQHVIAFAALGVPVAAWTGRGRVLTAIALAAAYGIVIELGQLVLPIGREASVLDAFADLAGAAIGAAVMMLARRA